MGLLEDPARRVQQAASLADCVDARLNEATRRVRARVDITLRPCVDRGRAPGEEGGSVGDADSGRDVVQLDVVEHKRAVQTAVARLGELDEGGCVGGDDVDDRLAAHSLIVLRRSAGCELETNLAVVDGDA